MKAHELTESESELLHKITSAISPAFSSLTRAFLATCDISGLDHRVAASAFSLYSITATLRILIGSSGMPLEEVDMEVVDEMAEKIQAQMAELVSAYIKNENCKLAEEN